MKIEQKRLEAWAKDQDSNEANAPKQTLITNTQLCKELGVTRMAISKWRRQHDNCPKKVNRKEPLEEWIAWLETRRQKTTNKNLPSLDREQYLTLKTSLECELFQIRIDKERNLLISREEKNQSDVEIGAAVRAAVLALETQLPSMLEGRTAEEIQKTLKEKTSEILQMLSEKQSDFWANRPIIDATKADEIMKKKIQAGEVQDE